MADPIIASATTLLSPAINAVVALRPEALAHFNAGGRWADLPALWRAQMLLNLARLSDEAQAARLRFATGAELRALCASEFNTTLPSAPQTAVGTLRLWRPLPAPGAHLPSGIVRTTDLFVKNAHPHGIALPDPSAYPIAIAAASYAPIQAAYLAQDQPSVALTLRAQRAGPDANTPMFYGLPPANVQLPPVAPASPLFDPNLSVAASAVQLAGGSSGADDPTLRAAARAYAMGQFGPTDGALVAGLLRRQDVRHFAAFRASSTTPFAQVYVADESWACCAYWMSLVAQDLADHWQGFGCRVCMGAIINQQVALSVTVTLKSTDSLNNTDAIDQNVRAAARAYFDDRPDWYRWRAATLQALLSHCDPRISVCSAVVLTDVNTGAVLAESPNSFGGIIYLSPTVLAPLTHFYLESNSVNATYVPPA